MLAAARFLTYGLVYGDINENESTNDLVSADSNDGDFCVVFAKATDPSNPNKTCGLFLKELQQDFVTTKIESRIYSLRVRYESLLRRAEEIRMLRETLSGRASQEFSLEFKSEFKNVSNEYQFFSSGERVLLGSPLLKKYDLVGNKKYVKSVFPLHSHKQIEWFLTNWVWRPFTNQPLNEIHGYFGSEIAFYFGFLGSYTRWLMFPAGFGVALWLFQRSRQGDDGGFDNVPTLLYSLFLSIWATSFFEMWKRRQTRYAFRWNALSADRHVPDRPEYREKAVLLFDEDTKTERYQYPSWKRLIAQLFSLTACALEVCVATFSMVYFLQLTQFAQKEWTTKEYTSHKYWKFAVHAPMIGYSLSLNIFANVNRVLASVLTKMEVHRTDEEHRDAVVLKLVSLQFVNFFLALFYTAFVVKDVSKLYKRLVIILSVNQVLGQVLELGVPLLKSFVSRMRLSKSTITNDTMSVRKQTSLEDYSGVFGDYLELWVQFGQVTLFASVFPLAGLLALLNNVVEIRSDAYKLLKATKRATPVDASGIGSWIYVFEALGNVAVATNVGLVGVIFANSPTGDYLLKDFKDWHKVLLLVFVEHLIFAVKKTIATFIPSTPMDVGVKLNARKKARMAKRAIDFEVTAKMRAKVGELRGDVSEDSSKPISTLLDDEDQRLLTAWLKAQRQARFQAEREKEALERELEFTKTNKRSSALKERIGGFAILLNAVLAGVTLVLVLSKEVRGGASKGEL